MKVETFRLQARPPFRLDLTVWALRRQPHNTIDRWDGAIFRRVLVVDGDALAVAARQVGAHDRPRLMVELTGERITLGSRRRAAAALRLMLGLDLDLAGFYALARRDRRLGPLAGRFLGMKPPRFPSLFEALVSAISCQQISLNVGIHLLSRLAELCGRGAPSGGALAHAFPEPEDVARLEPRTLRSLGYSLSKARALIETARAFACGSLDPGRIARLDDQAAVQALRELRGVGQWTAEYALLRGLGRTSIFPATDSGAARGLTRLLGLRQPLATARAALVARRFSPYAGLVYFHLLLDRLAEKGHLT